MQIALVGLGKMGGNMVKRLMGGDHHVVGFDRDPNVVGKLAKEVPATGKFEGATSLEEVVKKLSAPRAVWVMVPSGKATEDTIKQLASLLSAGDIIIDGGNSNFHDSQRHAVELAEKKIRFLDAGTSGGVWGLEVGYSLMVGGDESAYKHVEPALLTLAPKDGLGYFGKAGAGHFTKMVHNGIEYAMMLAERAFNRDPELKELKAWVDDSGEGRWTVNEAIAHAVPVPTIAASLFARFSSRQDNSFGLRVLSALRNEFGGHAVKKA
jgi:6-phosphogluconate dehydrogenase